jgi:hypothetical protein
MLATLLLAAALHPVEPSTSGGTRFDGERYAAWTRGAQVRVLDEQTGTTTSFDTPAGCRDDYGLGAGTLAFICGHAFKTLDVATGAVTDVPAGSEIASLFEGTDGVGLGSVGRVWLEIWPDLGYHSAEDPAWVERSTGRVIYDDPGDLTKHADLDAPSLFVKLCDPLRRRRNPQFDEFEGGTTHYVEPTLSGNAALDLRGEDTLILRRCGTRRTTVLTRTHTWLSAAIGGGRAAWIDRGRLRVYDVATGARDSFAIPGRRTRDVGVVATRDHVFVDKGTTAGGARRYAVEPRPSSSSSARM